MLGAARLGRRGLPLFLAVATAVVGLAGAAGAQPAGAIRGNVLAVGGDAVGGAEVVVIPLDQAGTTVRLETDADGSFAHPGLVAGLYAMSAVDGRLGSEEYRVRVRAGRTVDVRFVLQPGVRRPIRTQADNRHRFLAAFDAGVGANRDGAYRTAAAHFVRAAGLNPGCLECRYNAGVAHAAREAWTEAEQAFLAVLEIDPQHAAAYYGLSMVYAKSGRADDAAGARGEANRIALASLAARQQRAADDVTRGIAFYDSGTPADARRLFERALAESPSYAPAHYWLGVTLAGGNETAAPADAARAAAAFRRYLDLDAAGELAAEARARLAALTGQP